MIFSPKVGKEEVTQTNPTDKAHCRKLESYPMVLAVPVVIKISLILMYLRL
jgi:hypothetical protein